MNYTPRYYREWSDCHDLNHFPVCIKESDLLIYSDKNLSSHAQKSIRCYRKQIEHYIKKRPEFAASLSPLPVDPHNQFPIINDMIQFSAIVNVGPMAAIAGAIAEYVGYDLLNKSQEIIIENGGDIFIKTKKKRTIAIFSGEHSPFNQKIGIRIHPGDTPLGICTSSGTIGHSLSFGRADAVVIVAQSAILADAAATRIANMIGAEKDIQTGLDFARTIDQIRGIIICINDQIGIQGNLDIVPI
jgi:ApbE superfamily uncharacterized protein (UPF0280 family)